MEISNDSMNDSDFFQISMTSVSFVSSSLTTGISLLSLSDKSAVDVVGDLDGADLGRMLDGGDWPRGGPMWRSGPLLSGERDEAHG